MATVWTYWTSSDSTGTVTTNQLWGNGYSADAAWSNWTTATCSGNSITWDNTDGDITISNCWFYWNDETGTTTVHRAAETEETLRQRRILEEEVKQQKDAADMRAIALLQDLITEEEFAIYEQYGRLLIKGREFDYLVQRDSGRVVRLEKDKVVDLCMHLEDYHAYSKHDNVIAMKLFITTREKQFNQEANRCQERQLSDFEQEVLKAANQ
jgi:hypothetical protein